MEERRKAKRVPVDAIMMYQILHYPDGQEGEYHKIGTPISVDISTLGLRIATKQKLPKGTELQIVLSISTTKKPMELTGSVVWINDEDDDSLYKIGIKFKDEIANDKIKLIEEYIKSHN